MDAETIHPYKNVIENIWNHNHSIWVYMVCCPAISYLPVFLKKSLSFLHIADEVYKHVFYSLKYTGT